MDIVKIEREQIDEVLDNAEDGYDALFGIYALIYPEWDNIEKLNGFQHTDRKTSNYITDRLWEMGVDMFTLINSGIGADDNLKEGEFNKLPFTLKEEPMPDTVADACQSWDNYDGGY